MSNLLKLEQGCKQISNKQTNNIKVVVSSRNNNSRLNNHLRKLNLVLILRNYLNFTPPCLQNEGQFKITLFNVRSIAGKTFFIHDILS